MGEGNLSVICGTSALKEQNGMLRLYDVFANECCVVACMILNLHIDFRKFLRYGKPYLLLESWFFLLMKTGIPG
jgi:hypothetical protein